MPKFESTLHFSKYFAFIQLFMLSGSLIITYFSNFSLLIKYLTTFSLLGYSFWNVYCQSRFRVIGHDNEGWYLEKAGEKFYVVLSGNSTVTSIVTLLRFTQKGKFLKQSCIIFKDTMPARIYSQLIVKIKYFKAA